MKTKIIPFDLETAKKIQAGEIEGKIITSNLENQVRILCDDLIRLHSNYNLVCAITRNQEEYIKSYTTEGRTANSDEGDLVLEVPDDEPQFKPFDRVLMRGNDASLWKAGHYSHEWDGKYCVSGDYYAQCIPYEGNEHLVGTTDKPKEE